MERLGEQSLLAVVGSIYEAALDPAQWQPVMHQLSQALRAPICNIYGIDLLRQTPLFFQSNDTPQEIVDSWTQTYVGQDARIPAIQRWPRCTLQTNDTLTERRRFERSALYADFLRPTDSDETLAASLLLQPDANVVVTFNRNGRLGAYDSAELRYMEALLPHLQRAAALSAKLSGLGQGPGLGLHGGEMEALPFGVLVLDARGQVLECNRHARERLRQGDGLQVRAGRLRAGAGASDAALQRAIGSALAARHLGEAMPPALMLARANRPPLQALLVPLPGDPQRFGLRQAALAITLFEPWLAPPPPTPPVPAARPRRSPPLRPSATAELTPAQRLGQLDLIELLCSSGQGLRPLLRSLRGLIQPLLDVQALRFEWRGADGELLECFCEPADLAQQLRVDCEGGGRLLLMRGIDAPFQPEEQSLALELARRIAPALRAPVSTAAPTPESTPSTGRRQLAGTLVLNADGSLRFHDRAALQSLRMIQCNAGDGAMGEAWSAELLVARYGMKATVHAQQACYDGPWGRLWLQRQQDTDSGSTLISLFQELPFASHLAQELAALRLPPRQLQVAWRLAHGLTNKRIAAETGLALDTVEEYAGLVYRRFEVQDRVGLLLRLAS